MIKISDLELYVGTKEEYAIAEKQGMAIVCAMNVGDGVSYRSVVGKTTAEDSDYLYKEVAGDLFLNLIDGKDPKYVSDELINNALAYIESKLLSGKKVFVYCSEGKSRAPSLAFMFLMWQEILPSKLSSYVEFLKLYPNYRPGDGIGLYISKRFFGI